MLSGCEIGVKGSCGRWVKWLRRRRRGARSDGGGQRRKPNLHHHCKTENLGRRVEVAKWIFAHPISISDTCYTEITVYSDSAPRGVISYSL